MPGSTDYPGALDNFETNESGTDPTRLVGLDVDNHGAALNAIEAELGADPSGSLATVRARLEAREAVDAQLDGLGLWLPSDDLPGRAPNQEIVLSSFPSGHGWTANVGTWSDDTADFVLGDRSWKVVTGGAGAAAYATKTLAAAVDLSDKFFRVIVKVDDITRLARLELFASVDTGFANYSRVTFGTNAGAAWVRSGEWAVITLSRGDFVLEAGSMGGWSSIGTLRIRAIDNGGGNAATARFQLISASKEPSRGIVSFTFDDQTLSQFTEARKKMDQYRFPGTAYVIADRVGGSGNATLAQLQNARDFSGWEIASHAYSGTVHDASHTGVTEAEAEADFLKLKHWLAKNGFAGGDHYAAPLGQWDATTRALARRYFRSLRTIYGHPATTAAVRETWPPADPHRLRAWTVSSTNTLAQVEAAIDKAEANHEWLILLFHTIGVGLNMTVSDFAGVVDRVAQYAHVENPTLVCKTVGEALRSGAA
jgi:peptidoglycan/xylan/chitin deacetylase (PgdA/CDA1 family)